MPHDDQRSVLQVTWNWRAPEADSAAAAGTRRPAVVQALVMGAVAATLGFGLGHVVAARIVALLTTIILGLGFLAPAAYRQVHRFGQTLGRIVGSALTYLLLVPFYILVVVPAALWLRLRGRDPLHRRRRSPEHTYWVARSPQDRAENIARQFLREDRTARGALRPVGSLPLRGRDPESRP